MRFFRIFGIFGRYVAAPAHSGDLPGSRFLGMLAELNAARERRTRFERHQKRTRLCGSAELWSTSRALVDVFKQSASSLAAAMGASRQQLMPAAEPFFVCVPPAK